MYKEMVLEIPGRLEKIVKQLPLHDIGEGAIAGEEVLVASPVYQYTVKVESNRVKLMVFERNQNVKDFATKFLLGLLSSSYYEKEEFRKTQLESLMRKHPERFFLARGDELAPEDAIDNLQKRILGSS